MEPVAGDTTYLTYSATKEFQSLTEAGKVGKKESSQQYQSLPKNPQKAHLKLDGIPKWSVLIQMFSKLLTKKMQYSLMSETRSSGSELPPLLTAWTSPQEKDVYQELFGCLGMISWKKTLMDALWSRKVIKWKKN